MADRMDAQTIKIELASLASQKERANLMLTQAARELDIIDARMDVLLLRLGTAMREAA